MRVDLRRFPEDSLITKGILEASLYLEFGGQVQGTVQRTPGTVI